MSKPDLEAQLPEAAEALLKDWPVAEQDWEQQVSLIDARITSAARLGSTGSTAVDAALLASPALPPEPGEPDESSGPSSALEAPSSTRSPSLADLARSSVQKQREREAESRAKASLSLVGDGSTSSPESASSMQKAVERMRRAGESSGAAADSGAPASAPRPLHALKARERLLWLGAIAAAVAVVVLFKRGAEPLPLVTTAPIRSEPAAIVQPSPGDAPKPAAEATNAAPVLAIEPSALPLAQAPALASAALAKNEPKTAQTPAPVASAARPQPRPSSEKIVLQDEAASAKAPGAAPAAASAATEAPVAQATADKKTASTEPPLRPADGTSGHIPAKPSTGAVQAAIGTVMGGARRCLSNGDEAPSVVVVFSSAGSVESVTVSSGSLAPAASECIRQRLSQARVQPFAEPNFSVKVTIRPY